MRTAVMAVAVGLIVVQPLLAVGLGLFGWLLPGFKRSSAARVARRRLVALAIAPFALAIVSLLQGDLTTSLHWLAQALLWGAVCLFPPVSRTAVKVGASAGV